MRERYLEHTQPFSLKALRSQFFQAVARLLYFQADQIVSVSKFNRTWQLQLNAPFERTQVIPNGIDPQAFTAVKHDYPTVVWLGRIDPLKDLETLIRAFWHVRRVIPNARLKLFGPLPEGNQPYYQTLLRLRESLHLKRAVSFEGQHPAQAALAQAEVVALSSLSESLPYSLLEAMASSKAIVATKTGGITEALGNAGRLVNIGEPAAMATALIELLSYPKVRERLGKRARYRALETFTLDKMIHRYQKIYESMSYAVNPKQSAVFLTTERPSELPVIVLRDQAV